MKHTSESQVSLAASLRQVVNQLLRLLEAEDPNPLLHDVKGIERALESWRRTIDGLTSGVDVKRARELEQGKLEMMGKLAEAQKVNHDLKERNKELLAQIVRLNEHETAHKQRVVELRFSTSGHKAEAKSLDLEVRELRRRIRELEGGPPLTAIEAAPQSLKKEGNDAGATSETPAIDDGPSPSLAAAVAAHKNTLGASEARSAAEEAFDSLWKEPAPAKKQPAKKQPTKKQP
ncbi:MAG: hypothetical protein KAI47_15180, partial [Deltaproteobacteria bacterium]|nr:hypothetical protein [Deltaproteobacteria bacterium]